MDTKTSGIFYKAVVQLVLLFVIDMWFMNLRIGRTLGGFHHWVARRMMVKKQSGSGREMELPPSE